MSTKTQIFKPNLLGRVRLVYQSPIHSMSTNLLRHSPAKKSANCKRIESFNPTTTAATATTIVLRSSKEEKYCIKVYLFLMIM